MFPPELLLRRFFRARLLFFNDKYRGKDLQKLTKYLKIIRKAFCGRDDVVQYSLG